MRALQICITLLLCLSISATAMAREPIETGTFNNDAIYGYDPVAYFVLQRATKGNDKYTSEWKGAKWKFASAEHKALFDSQPNKYAPQYGGYCAFAMSKGRFVGIDEDAFTVYKGKLYLNYSKSVMQEWRENKDGYIQLANTAYELELLND